MTKDEHLPESEIQTFESYISRCKSVSFLPEAVMVEHFTGPPPVRVELDRVVQALRAREVTS
jgi:hypothetical protein